MRLWLAARVNARWPFLASVLVLGLEEALRSLCCPPEAVEVEEDPEPAPSRGKMGSRPEDLQEPVLRKPPGASGYWVHGHWVEHR